MFSCRANVLRNCEVKGRENEISFYIDQSRQFTRFVSDSEFRVVSEFEQWVDETEVRC